MTLTTAIARELMRLGPAEQREAFAAILAFLRHQTGEEVTSLHCFIEGGSAPALNDQTREQLLGRIAAALRAGEISQLHP